MHCHPAGVTHARLDLPLHHIHQCGKKIGSLQTLQSCKVDKSGTLLYVPVTSEKRGKQNFCKKTLQADQYDQERETDLTWTETVSGKKQSNSHTLWIKYESKS